MTVDAVTPDGRLFATDSASLVELPTSSGELGILPGHTLLISNVSAGELRVHCDDGLRSFVVAGGFVRVSPEAVQLLLTFASAKMDDDSEIEAACQRAREALEQEAILSQAAIDADIAMVEACLARLPVKHRSSGLPAS